jgi:hypothetical protein
MSSTFKLPFLALFEFCVAGTRGSTFNVFEFSIDCGGANVSVLGMFSSVMGLLVFRLGGGAIGENSSGCP